MGRTTLKDEYFSWLCERVKILRPTYIQLCHILHEKEFRWSVDYDENRCEDGLDLRDTFYEEKRLDESHVEVAYWLRAKCSVLEVLVALAKRMNDLMYDLNHQEDHTAKWFLEMLTNLGLNRFDDSESVTLLAEVQIDEILEIWLDRTYDQNGRGGLFPIKKSHPKDMSRVEIWYQLMSYMDENYS